MKLFRVLRSNWKKSLFFCALSGYGAKYLIENYQEHLIRRVYCSEALKYGQVPLPNNHRNRRVTVILNPAANGGRSKNLFEKNIAPLLYLAGLEVTIVRTECEGQAKKFMQVLQDTDAILIAGGNATVLEVVTGLLRRPDSDAFRHIPIGILPVGCSNRAARSIFGGPDDSQARWFSDVAMAVIRETTRPIHVLQIKNDEGKEAFALADVRWGRFVDAANRVGSKHQYTRWLRQRLALLKDVLQGHEGVPLRAQLAFQHSCDGCTRCHIAPSLPPWRWWQLFLSRPSAESGEADHSKTENVDCDRLHEREMTFTEVHAKVNWENKCVDLRFCAAGLTKRHFLQHGVNLFRGSEPGGSEPGGSEPGGSEPGRSEPGASDWLELQAKYFNLSAVTGQEEDSSLLIDSEKFAASPIQVTLLKDKLLLFCPTAKKQTEANMK